MFPLVSLISSCVRQASKMSETEMERLTCLLCREFFKATATCSSSHVICDICYKKLDPPPDRRCPLCQAAYWRGANPNIEFEWLIRQTIVECRFQPEGCGEVFSLTEKRKLENTCFFYQTFKCPFIQDEYFFSDVQEPCGAEVTPVHPSPLGN